MARTPGDAPLPPRLLCDEMLHGLGRWLRAAGYDAAVVDRGRCDRDVLAAAAAERRLLLTCDRRVPEHRAARGCTLVLDGVGLDAWALELRERLGIDWLLAPFSRCLLDNVPLRPASPAERGAIPEQARDLPGPISACDACGRLYWPGSHVRRMRARLTRWRGGG